MNRILKETIYEDYGFKNYFQYFQKCFFYPEIKLGCQWRKAQYYTTHKNIFLRFFWKFKWLMIRKKTKCQISLRANIAPGLKLLHDGSRVIVSNVKIGRDCMIGINVIIGYSYSATEKRFEIPTIGDRVYIGHNVSIVGNITVGNDVLIAPNTFVNRSVPDHSIVLGNNIIIPKESPSTPYIKNLIQPSCSKRFFSI